jgi:hypothetical protein
MHSRADFIVMVGRFGPKAQTPRASRSCPVRPQARRPVIFEPGASRPCPLRLQREASAEP